MYNWNRGFKMEVVHTQGNLPCPQEDLSEVNALFLKEVIEGATFSIFCSTSNHGDNDSSDYNVWPNIIITPH